MSDAKLPPPTPYQRALREGTWLAAVAGFLSSTASVAVILGDEMGNTELPMLAASAIASATIILPFFWRQLAPTGRGFSIGMSALAGVLTVILCHALMWVFTVAAVAITATPLGPDVLSFLYGVMLSFFTSLLFTGFSVVLAGWITIPLGVLASVLVTLWARRRVAAAA